MDYRQARDYLERAAARGGVLGLDRIRELLRILGDPQDGLKFIHISGTNGKGSVLAYLSTILKEAGYTVGRYISPTLFSYRERIQVNGEYIGREELAQLTQRAKEAVERMEAQGGALPSAFEIETAIAFLYFLQKNCDIVVLETGMGGDTDATNVIRTTVLEVLTPVSMDHMQFLGDTLAQIAEHKAGIIKPNTVVVSARQEPEAMKVIARQAKKQGAVLYVADDTLAQNVVFGLEEQRFSYGGYRDIKIRLAGHYQVKNAVVAVECVKALAQRGFAVSEEQMRAGFAKTVWTGRFTVLAREPLFIIDGAHNCDGARELRASIETYLQGKRIYAICGVFADKEYGQILQTVAPLITRMTAVQTPDNPRALPAEKLAEAARGYIDGVQPAASLAEAVEQSFALAQKDDAILAFGSLSFLGEIKRIVEKRQERS